MADPQARGLERRSPALSPADGDSAVLFGVVACFVLSGFSGLLYQTAWLRQFTLVFGTSELAVVTVLAAYMAGLAAGSALSGRYVGRIRRPILVYGVLEAGVALSALAVPGLLDLASAFYQAVLGGQPAPPASAGLGPPVFYVCVAFLVLGMPAALMGATLPLLTRHVVDSDRELGPRVALLYAANTAGAVAGTLATGFVLLTALGLTKTVWVGVGINALVFALAAALSLWVPPRSASSAAAKPLGFFAVCIVPLMDRSRSWRERTAGVFRTQPAWILPLMLASGATAFVYEVLWTRLLAHVLDGSIYAFATMLAAFLSGIAIGGALAGRVAEHGERAALAFVGSQLGIAVLSMAVYAGIGPLMPLGQHPVDLMLYACAVMLPATVFIGATFPLAVRILARDEREAGAVTARVYAWNTLGAIAGALLAGFVLLPELGFEGSIKLAVCANLALALFTLALVSQPRREYIACVALALLALIAFYYPGRPQAVVSNFHLTDDLADPHEVFYAVGRSATVLVQRDGDRLWLMANGLPEASIAARGSAPNADTDYWLTTLPVMARPDLETMLVVGLGGGVALEALPPSVQKVDVVELEQEMLNANRHLAHQRRRDPLSDARINVVINDARNALRMTDRRYDAIVSQPSHPWTAGASHLFTRDFIRIVKEHLEPDGVFVQWMSADFLTEPLLRSLTATLLGEFEGVRLYRPARTALFFLASDGPLDVEQELARTGRPLSDAPAHYHRVGLSAIEDLVAALIADDQGLREFAQGASIITDDHNHMATQSRGRGYGLTGADISALFAEIDPLVDASSFVYRELDGPTLRFSYIARRAIADGQLERARGIASAVDQPATAEVILSLLHQQEGDALAAETAARAALIAEPEGLEAPYLLVSNSAERLSQLSADQQPEELRDLVARLSGPSLAVVRGSSLASRRDWAALAQLEPDLALSQSTDLWYVDALRLRATWRTYVVQDRQRFAHEALLLLDEALILQDHFLLHLLRVRNAIALGDDESAVASALGVVEYYERALPEPAALNPALANAQLVAMRRNLAIVIRLLGLDSGVRRPESGGNVLARAQRLESAIAAEISRRAM